MRILIVEDDSLVAKNIQIIFKDLNINSDHVVTGEEAMEYINTYVYDLIILDLILPDMQGYEVLTYLREKKKSETPVLILSGLSESIDKVKGLNKGADDFLTKPFNRQELIARINAIIRRYQGYSSSVINIGDLNIDIDKKQATMHNETVKLTHKEYNIIEILSLRKGKIVSKEAILDQLYGGLDEPEPKIIDVFICKLRKKLMNKSEKLTGKKKNYISTIWGQGYLVKDPDADLDI